MNMRIQEAVDASMVAIWEQIVLAFPECKTRKVPTSQQRLLKAQIDDTIRHYLQLNHPDFTRDK